MAILGHTNLEQMAQSKYAGFSLKKFKDIWHIYVAVDQDDCDQISQMCMAIRKNYLCFGYLECAIWRSLRWPIKIMVENAHT